MSLALVFPGQGSQSVGMMTGLAAEYPIVTATFARASAVLGYDLWSVVTAGPLERLNATACTQPAMLAAGFATWQIWRQAGGATPLMVSGHSLGEFTALTCAGALSFEAAIALVAARGELMQSAVPQGAGAMAAVLGLDDAQVEAACAEATSGGLGGVAEAVNYNSPGQVVIAGDVAAVGRALEAAKARGAKRAMPLPVSVPAHSSLMLAAAEKFGERLATVSLQAPAIPYFSAVDGALHSAPDELRANLVRQLASPVRWSQTVQALVAGGATLIIECGPGKVLTALNRRIARGPEIQYAALEDSASLNAALAFGNASGAF
jgi:[acyl-carrier-protein] S-malonyltransferase